MTVASYKRATLILSTLAVLLLWLAWHLNRKYAMQRLNERDTWLAIADFERSRNLALQSEPKAAAEMLDEIAHFGWRLTNGPLGMIVERDRRHAVREVIDYLRKKTGEDLGDDPQKWISKYGN